MKIDVDVERLRKSLLDRAGSAAGVGFPAAMLDVVDIEDESPQELLARAEREGLGLRDFAVDDEVDFQSQRNSLNGTRVSAASATRE